MNRGARTRLRQFSVSGILVLTSGLGGSYSGISPTMVRAVAVAPTYRFVPGARWTFHLTAHLTFLILPHNRRGVPLFNESAITSPLGLNFTIHYTILSRVPGGALVQDSRTQPAAITVIHSDGVPLDIGPADEITGGFWWTEVGVGLLPHRPVKLRLRWSSSHPLRILIEDPVMPVYGAPPASALTVVTYVNNVITSLTTRRMTVSTIATLRQHDVTAHYHGGLARSITSVHAHVERFAYQTIWVFDLTQGRFISGRSTLKLCVRFTYTLPHRAKPRVLMQNQTMVMDMHVR